VPGGGLGGLGGSAGLTAIGLIVVVVWLLAGIYIVEPAEEGVVLRFGAYHETTESGPHWAPYFVDSVEKVNVEQVRRVEIGFRSEAGGQRIGHESLMLTRDENIVDIQFAVQYRIKNSQDYLFQVLDPETTLKDVTESAVRDVVGKSDMDFVLTDGRSKVAADIKDLTQSILDHYQAGLLVTSVNMQSAQPPEQVQEAFADAVRAREDEERVKNEARAFAADILPKARGEANAVLERAQGYKQRVISLAQGDAARFLSVLKQYERAPDVTRERLYIDAVESVLSSTSKVLVDVGKGNNLLYVPLDKLIAPGGERGAVGSGARPSFNSDKDNRVPLGGSRGRGGRGRGR